MNSIWFSFRLARPPLFRVSYCHYKVLFHVICHSTIIPKIIKLYFVFSSVWPSEFPIAFLFIILVFPFISYLKKSTFGRRSRWKLLFRAFYWKSSLLRKFFSQPIYTFHGPLCYCSRNFLGIETHRSTKTFQFLTFIYNK